MKTLAKKIPAILFYLAILSPLSLLFTPHARADETPDIRRGDTDKMEVALTFDGASINGKGPGEAREILKALRERKIKATVFLTGAFIRDFPEIVKEMAADGHEVGNHTMTHPHLTDFDMTSSHNTLPNINREVMVRELRETEGLFRKVTGRALAPVWRAPYGEINGEIREWAFEAGYIHVGWTSDYRANESLDALDWVAEKASILYLPPAGIKDRLLGFGKGRGGLKGGIILMHLVTDRTDDKAVSVLGDLIDSLVGRGYRFVKVSRFITGHGLELGPWFDNRQAKTE